MQEIPYPYIRYKHLKFIRSQFAPYIKRSIYIIELKNVIYSIE